MRYRAYLLALSACLVTAVTLRAEPPAPGARLAASSSLSAASSVRAQASSAQAAPAASAAPQAGYVGSDTCLACHTDKGDSLKGTAHAKPKNPRTPAATHGLRELPRSRAGARGRRSEGAHPEVRPDDARRDQPDVPDLPQPRQPRGLGRQRARTPQSVVHHLPQRAQPEVAQNGSSSRPRRPSSVRPVIACRWPRPSARSRTCRCARARWRATSCHNPHGSISNVKALKVGSSVAELCTSCHTEMRGPMLWEHAPVRENCATCHDPHGSSNDRMLVVRMPMLCQRCHVATRHPATIYDNDAITTNKSNRMFGRSCVNCHSNVHGSNHPSGPVLHAVARGGPTCAARLIAVTGCRS